MEPTYKVRWLMDETYQVLDVDEVVYQGSLSDCESYIRLHDGGYM